jgi:S1-C subfamily serine protease
MVLFITDDGYLISNYHVVKDATKIRLVTSAGTVDAKVVQIEKANALALLKADGKFSPLPIGLVRLENHLLQSFDVIFIRHSF